MADAACLEHDAFKWERLNAGILWFGKERAAKRHECR